MNKILEDKLRILAGDSLMLRAITAIIDERIEEEKPEPRETDDDNVLGQKYRAYKQANEILRLALIDIDSYKDEKTEPGNIDKHK